MLPFQALRYLYVGSSDVDRDLAYQLDVLGAELVWDFRAFGARVAAVRVSEGPLVLLADHRPAPSVMPIYAVRDLEPTTRDLESRGWKMTAGPFGIPDGDCCTYTDPSGNEYAVFEETRPDALVAAYADPENPRAVQHPGTAVGGRTT